MSIFKAIATGDGGSILPMFLPGGVKTVRERHTNPEGKLKCAFCAASPRTMYSYDDADNVVCNRDHYLAFVSLAQQSRSWRKYVSARHDEAEVTASHRPRLRVIVSGGQRRSA